MIVAALTDVAKRPSARTHLQTFLASKGHPDQISDTPRTNTLLAAIAMNGWDEAVADMLAAGANVHAASGEALCRAAENGHLSVVARLLAAGADVHANGDYPLRCAALAGHLPVIECLLAAGADVHANDDGALRWAACNGHLPVVRCLVSHAANLHAKHDEALREAAYNEHRAVVEYLLGAGASATNAVDCVAENKPMVCRTLNAAATAIPAAQRQDLIVMEPHLFPALRALRDAEQRQSTRPHPVTPSNRIQKP